MESILILIILAALIGGAMWFYFKEYLVKVRSLESDMLTLNSGASINHTIILDKVNTLGKNVVNSERAVTSLIHSISENNKGALSDILKNKYFKTRKPLDLGVKELIKEITDHFILILGVSVTSSSLTVTVPNGSFKLAFSTGRIKVYGSGASHINITSVFKKLPK